MPHATNQNTYFNILSTNISSELVAMLVCDYNKAPGAHGVPELKKYLTKINFQVFQKTFDLVGDQEAGFMRKGKTGGWKNHFDAETIEKFNKWERKWLEGTDLKFCYNV